MDPVTAIALLVVGSLAGAAIAVGLRRLRRAAPNEALIAFASQGGHLVTGDGVRLPLHVVGVQDGRTFSLTYASGPGGDELLAAVDCAGDAEGQVGGAPVVQGDDALAVRIVRPLPSTWADLGGLVAALTELAAGAERDRPHPADPEP